MTRIRSQWSDRRARLSVTRLPTGLTVCSTIPRTQQRRAKAGSLGDYAKLSPSETARFVRRNRGESLICARLGLEIKGNGLSQVGPFAAPVGSGDNDDRHPS